MSLSSSAIRMEEKKNEFRRRTRAKVDLDVKLDRTGKKDVIDKKKYKDTVRREALSKASTGGWR